MASTSKQETPAVPFVQTQTVLTQQPTVSLIVQVPEKKICEAYILGIPLGWLGLHQFYLGRSGWGTLYLFTLGLFGIGWVVDLFRMPCLVSSINKERLERARSIPRPPEKKRVDDAYILCIPFGWLGLHHFYLERPGWGCLYMFTLGIFGIGWLFDMFRLPCLVSSVNEDLLAKHERSISTAPGCNQGRVTVTVYQNTNIVGFQQPPSAPIYPAASPYPTGTQPAGSYPPPYNVSAVSAEPPPPSYSNLSFTQTTETTSNKGSLP